ncbi:MAG: NCS2 family permease [Treponema sp.]|nr:NCS2 family permease [Candidatus Treponema caballi]
MEKFFKLKERGTTVSKEIVGGITTFLAMAYILALNPDFLSAAGLPWEGVFTATAISAGIATLVMAFIANLPVALASGLGLNAFFAYTVVIGMGYSPYFALTAILFEGIIFIILSLCGVREAIIKSIPEGLKKAVAVGIGLFITIIGLANAGVCDGNQGTLIGFVKFTKDNSQALLAIIGLIITIVLYILKVPGSVLIGIVVTTVIGIIPYFGATVIPADFKPFKLPAAPIFCKFEFNNVLTIDFLIVMITFLFTDMFDTIGTLLGVAEQGNLKDENGDIINVRGALLADAVGTVAGACLGTSTVTSFVESSSGVAAGARTGLASVVTGILFLLSLFLWPLFALIPSAATAPALIFVGFLMMKSVVDIKFDDPTEGIPAFLTIMAMPFAYSIAAGIRFGIVSYVITKCAAKKVKEIPVVTWILAAIFIASFVFDAVNA